MRERFVEFIVSSTTRNCRKDIVEYGIDIFIGESLCFISIIGLGYITGHKLESIIYLICMILGTGTMGGVSL